MCPPDQAIPAAHRDPVPLRRLRDPRQVRGRVRTRPGRPLPHARLHRRPDPEAAAGIVDQAALCCSRTGMLRSPEDRFAGRSRYPVGPGVRPRTRRVTVSPIHPWRAVSILIVIIVAMFIEWVISGDGPTRRRRPYSTRRRSCTRGAVRPATCRTASASSVILDPASARPSSPRPADLIAPWTPFANTQALGSRSAADQPEVVVTQGARSCPPQPPRTVQPSFTSDVVKDRVSVMNVKDQTMEVTLLSQ